MPPGITAKQTVAIYNESNWFQKLRFRLRFKRMIGLRRAIFGKDFIYAFTDPARYFSNFSKKK